MAGLRYEGLAWLRRSNSYYYVLSGLAALLGLFAVAALLHLFGGMLGFLRGLAVFAGVALTWFAGSTGFGAVILSRAGTRRDYVWRARTSRFDGDSDYVARESAGA
jgi:cytochrome b subunit of formate dehydrogenase